MSEPTASEQLAATVRYEIGVARYHRDGSPYEGKQEAFAALDALVARVDTLTRDVRTALGAAERFREQGIKDAERAEAAEAALADTRRALECDHHETAWTFIEHEGEMWNICHDCGLMEKWAGGQRFAQQVDYERARALAAGDKP